MCNCMLLAIADIGIYEENLFGYKNGLTIKLISGTMTCNISHFTFL